MVEEEEEEEGWDAAPAMPMPLRRETAKLENFPLTMASAILFCSFCVATSEKQWHKTFDQASAFYYFLHRLEKGNT